MTQCDSFQQNPDVVILCGGAGKRFRSIKDDIPKALAPISNEKTILDLIIGMFVAYGSKRFVLCTGYLGEQIHNHVRRYASELKIVISHEMEPFGTAGAVKHAEQHIFSNPFFVVNGDSYCAMNPKNFLNFYLEKTDAVAVIALTPSCERRDAGNVRVDSKTQRVVSFTEKVGEGSNNISAGVYLFDRAVLTFITAGRSVSLEYDIFPRLLERGVYGFRAAKTHIDIGIPERYKKALRVLNS